MTYNVVITREGDTWLADVPDVPGAHTFARSLEGLHKSIREVIILMDDLEDDAKIDVMCEYSVADELVKKAAEVGRERSALAAKDQELRDLTAWFARRLTLSGYSVRDSAAILEMTPGRISQLTASKS